MATFMRPWRAEREAEAVAALDLKESTRRFETGGA